MQNELRALLTRPKKYYYDLLIKNFGEFDFRKPVVLFGAAKMAKVYLNLCKKNKVGVICLCDNDKRKKGKHFLGKQIISIEDLKKMQKNTQIIITSIYDDEINDQLRTLGFFKVWPHSFFSSIYPEKFHNPYWQNSIHLILAQKEMVESSYALFKDKKSKITFLQLIKYRLFLKRSYLKKMREPLRREYFDKDIVSLSSKEVFVDGGAYDGDTMKKFMETTKRRFTKIYAFEPDDLLFNKLKIYRSKLEDNRIMIFKLGLSSRENKMGFVNDATLGSRISKEGRIRVRVAPLDKLIPDNEVTFMKLDIEGAEWDALKGARQTIKRNKPKLAICTYHLVSDLWRIPLFLKKINSNYTFYLRHYSLFLYDTICYAI